MHSQGKRMVVHVGGPVRRLLPGLASAGVDGIEGIAGPPQGDATLAQSRELTGATCALWGGISQDVLLPAHSQAAFEAAVHQAVGEAADDPRAILGIADRVPVDADVDRLAALPCLVREAGS